MKNNTFTPMHCKACGKEIIYVFDDDPDELCLECLSYVEDAMDYYDDLELEIY